jgi:phytoene dehydrogenase-like protein
MSTTSFDAVVIGSGLGGLTAGALLAKAGYSVCLLERNTGLGGAASCYRVGNLTIEAALHETADPRDPREVKHGILKRLDLLDKLNWLPVGGCTRSRAGRLASRSRYRTVSRKPARRSPRASPRPRSPSGACLARWKGCTIRWGSSPRRVRTAPSAGCLAR